MTPKEKKIFVKIFGTIAEQGHQLRALSFMLAHHTSYLHSTMQECSVADCQDVATVRNEALDVFACDMCAARIIVRGRQALKNDNSASELNVVRLSASRLELWRDLPVASSIRTITKHRDLIIPKNLQ